MDIKQLKHREFVAWCWASTSTIAFFAVLGFLHWWCLLMIPMLLLSLQELFNADKALKDFNKVK